MKKGVCASCLDFDIEKVVKSKESLKPDWLKETDYVREFINNHSMSLKKPDISNVEMNLELGEKVCNRKILYWAADEKNEKNPIITDAKTAYNKFENSGVTKSNDKGSVKIRFACPQLYKAKQTSDKKDITFFRHIHFVIEKDGVWDAQIYTKIVICKYDLSKFLKNKKEGLTVLINALPSEYYGKDHVPNSYNLFNKEVSKMSIDELKEWFEYVIRVHYPKLYEYVKSKRLEIYEVPIIVYCAHEKCNAAELTIKELMKKGFVNINEFSGGMKEYSKYRKFVIDTCGKKANKTRKNRK